MAYDEERREEAASKAKAYRKAVAYLNSNDPITFEKYSKVLKLARSNVDASGEWNRWAKQGHIKFENGYNVMSPVLKASLRDEFVAVAHQQEVWLQENPKSLKERLYLHRKGCVFLWVIIVGVCAGVGYSLWTWFIK